VKRLLLLAYFYPPLAGGGVHRVLSFTRHLPAHGWECTVVCAGEHDYWVRDESLLACVPPGTEVIRVAGGSALAGWLRLRGRAGSGQRSGGAFAPLRTIADWLLLPDSYAGWSRRAAGAARERIACGGVHAVLSSSPPDSVHLAAAAVAQTSGLPWVADFRDPWIGLHFRKPPTPWHRSRQTAMEASVIGQADLVLAASRTHVDALAARATAKPRKLLHLPNGFEPEPEGGRSAASASEFRAVFTGTLSLMDDVGTLLDAVRALIEQDPSARAALRVDLVGPYDRDWQARAVALGVAGVVRFTGALSHAAARAQQSAADLLVLWRPQGAGFRTMVPGKLYEYLDSGRPVLALLPADDEAAGLVVRAGGRVIAPGDRRALAGELAARLARWRAGERVPSRRPEWLAAHTRAHLAGELANGLDALPPGTGA
jgi:glycosyltransferase involved in cell wall biosynthesis